MGSIVSVIAVEGKSRYLVGTSFFLQTPPLMPHQKARPPPWEPDLVRTVALWEKDSVLAFGPS